MPGPDVMEATELDRRRGGMRAVLLFVLALTVARLAYLAFFCPYTLIEDEAHYWEWSRHLALSYYSKGPGVAWVIAAGTSLLGHTELGVRLFAPIFSAAATLALAGLARAAHPDRRLPLFTAAAFQLIPAYQLTSFLFTIDMPYVACWAGAAWAGWYAIERRRGWAWPALGAALALGFLFKYTILLLIPGLAIFAILRARRSHRSSLSERNPTAPVAANFAGPLLATAVFTAAVMPILIWNYQHGWPTIRHLLGHLGMAGGDVPIVPSNPGPAYTPVWTLEYIGAQFGLVGPMLILMIMSAVRCWRTRRGPGGVPASLGDLYAFACAAPIVLFYLAVSFITEGEGNWAIAGYCTLTIPAARLVLDAMDQRRASAAARRRPAHRVWNVVVLWGVLAALLMLRIDWLAAIPRVGSRLPVGRLLHADDRAREMAAIADDLAHRTGQVPFYMAQHYGRASQMAFYLPGHPTVYCTSRLTGGRATQYDLWPFTDLTNPATQAALEARPAVLSGGERYHWDACFAEVHDRGMLASESKRGRMTYEGLGYRGFPDQGGGPAR